METGRIGKHTSKVTTETFKMVLIQWTQICTVFPCFLKRTFPLSLWQLTGNRECFSSADRRKNNSANRDSFSISRDKSWSLTWQQRVALGTRLEKLPRFFAGEPTSLTCRHCHWTREGYAMYLLKEREVSFPVIVGAVQNDEKCENRDRAPLEKHELHFLRP